MSIIDHNHVKSIIFGTRPCRTLKRMVQVDRPYLQTNVVDNAIKSSDQGTRGSQGKLEVWSAYEENGVLEGNATAY